MTQPSPLALRGSKTSRGVSFIKQYFIAAELKEVIQGRGDLL